MINCIEGLFRSKKTTPVHFLESISVKSKSVTYVIIVSFQSRLLSRVNERLVRVKYDKHQFHTFTVLTLDDGVPFYLFAALSDIHIFALGRPT